MNIADRAHHRPSTHVTSLKRFSLRYLLLEVTLFAIALAGIWSPLLNPPGFPQARGRSSHFGLVFGEQHSAAFSDAKQCSGVLLWVYCLDPARFTFGSNTSLSCDLTSCTSWTLQRSELCGCAHWAAEQQNAGPRRSSGRPYAARYTDCRLSGAHRAK